MKLDYNKIKALLSDNPADEEKFRWTCANQGLVYVRPHCRNWPTKPPHGLERFLKLRAKKLQIVTELKRYKPMLRKIKAA